MAPTRDTNTIGHRRTEAMVRMRALYPISVASASRHSTAVKIGAADNDYGVLRRQAGAEAPCSPAPASTYNGAR